MGEANFSEEFKRDAVAQITERGYWVAEVSQRLGVSPHSLHAWKRQLAKVVSGDASKNAEIRQLKRELARVTEERDILKKPPRISPGMQCEIYKTREVARQDVFDYIEMFYNPVRKHVRNGMLAPVRCKRQ